MVRDEYGDTHTRRSLLSLISDNFTQLPHNVRFLITSRPESDIHNSFVNNHKILSKALSEDAVGDIGIYLTYEMDRIRKERQIDVTDWPKKHVLYRLVEMSEGLFIWASTLSLLLLDSVDPVEQLDRIVHSKSDKYARGLDQLYETVLMARNDWDEGLGERFRDVAGIILFCHTPLSDVDIDQLLGLPKHKSCRTMFRNLQSLFDYAPGWPIRPLHASFRDYLTDKARSGGKPWSLAGFDAHHHLAMCCLQIMLKQLRFNICNFETSHKLNCEYPDLQERIEKNISSALEYASISWFLHLGKIRSCGDGLLDVLLPFLRGKLLFWVEVAALIGRQRSGEGLVLSRFVNSCEFSMVKDPDAIAILNCLAQFIDRHTTSAAIPHIYVSGFVLAPHSLLRTLYAPNRTIEYTDIPIDSFGLSKIWSSERLTIQSLSCNPSGLCFISKRSLVNRDWRQTEISYDGTVQCERWLRGSFPPDWHGIPIERHTSSTISRDLTKLACTNGQVLNFTYATRMSHTKRISGAKPVFHPTNSNLLAYIRIGGIICIYDLTETPRIRIQFQTDARQSSLLVWSPDGIYLASNTGWSGHTTVWKIDYITNTAALNGESNFRCHPLCFQPTRQSRILVQSDEGMISLLDFTSGDIDIYKTYDFSKFIDMNTSTGATFSPDGSTFATFQQRSDTVVVFETETGKRYRDPIVTPSPVIRVDYLPDGKRFILVCEQRYYLSETQIYIADVHADLCVSEEDRFNYANKMGQLKGITSACFSPDGRKFLTSSRDGTVHVRSTTDCMLLREYWPLEHSSAVLCAVFSIDGNSIYCALMDGTVRTSSGKTLYTTKGDTHGFSIKTYMSDSLEERVVVIESDRVVVISGEGTLIHGPYKIGGTYAQACVSHHGLLAYRSEDGDKVLFLNLDTGYSPPLLRMHRRVDAAIALSRDGSVLASRGARYSQDKPAFDVWDVNTGTLIRSIAPVHEFMFLDTSYLPLANNHRSLVVVFRFGETLTVQAWNLEPDSNSPTINYSTHIGRFEQISGISLSPTGKNLVMASKEGIVMWDLALLESKYDHTSHSNVANAENSIHSSTMPINWRMERDRDDAWILGPNRERLLCVPRDFWRELDPPGSTHVIRRRRRKLDFSRFVHGEDWVQCYQPLEDEEASD